MNGKLTCVLAAWAAGLAAQTPATVPVSGQVADLQRTALEQYEQSRYSEALATRKKLLAILQHNLGAEHSEIAAVLNNMGMALRRSP